MTRTILTPLMPVNWIWKPAPCSHNGWNSMRRRTPAAVDDDVASVHDWASADDGADVPHSDGGAWHGLDVNRIKREGFR